VQAARGGAGSFEFALGGRTRSRVMDTNGMMLF
jgi:hypothetical protein